MHRNLKMLNLALIAMFTLGTLLASAASAAPKSTPVPEEYPFTWKAAQVTTHVFALEGGRKFECATANLEGTVSSKAQAEESKLTTTPAYGNCTATILGNKELATITMNGCRYLVTSTETATGTIKAEGWEVTASLQLKCPVGAKMELHVYTSEANDLSNTPLCTYAIAEQAVGGSLDNKLTEKNAEGAGTSGAVKSTLTGVATTKVSGTLTNCGAVSQTGSTTGEVKGEFFNTKGEMMRAKVED